MTDRLNAQIAFLTEADRLKSVERSNVLMDLSRPENSAEHSWHLTLWALIMGDDAPSGVSLPRVIRMLILHDLVEIDCGDHPTHLDTDWDAVIQAEGAAAQRIFGLLPADLAENFLSLWQEFEAAETPDAQFAKRLDHAQPIFQVLDAPKPLDTHLTIARDNLATGRAARFSAEWPSIYAQAIARQDGNTLDDSDLTKRLRFLAEADRLKSVNRATLLNDRSRRENSAEHSWHLTLFAMTLADQAAADVDITRVITMLILHDLVEIDAGDAPIFGAIQPDLAAEEAAAADRIFGLLPASEGAELRALWDEFEAAQSPDARFAKALDRFQPPIQNLASGGGTWVEYNVTPDKIAARVAPTIQRGAPALWDYLTPRISAFFATA